MKSKIVLIVLMFVLVALAGFFIVRYVARPKVATQTKEGLPLDSYTVELQKNRDDLKAFLSGQKVDEAAVYRGVIQLAEVKDPVALETAGRLKESPSKYFREGAAQAFGYFDSSDAAKALKDLTGDKEPSVRAFAIQALGRSSNEERRKILDDLGEKAGLTDEETIALADGQFKAAESSEEKEAALASLAKLAAGKKPALSSQAALKMVELAPESSHTRDVLHRKITENTDAPAMGTGIRTLSSQRDPWIAPKLEALASHESPLVRKAVIQSLHRICPANRWAIMTTVAQRETDPSVIEVVIDEAMLIPEKNVQTFLEAIADLPLVKKYEAKKADDAIKRVQTEKLPNACLGR